MNWYVIDSYFVYILFHIRILCNINWLHLWLRQCFFFLVDFCFWCGFQIQFDLNVANIEYIYTLSRLFCYHVLHPVSLVNKKQLIIIKRNMSTALVKEILLLKSSQYPNIVKIYCYLMKKNELKKRGRTLRFFNFILLCLCYLLANIFARNILPKSFLKWHCT